MVSLGVLSWFVVCVYILELVVCWGKRGSGGWDSLIGLPEY